jgi:hypothetical protein
MGVNRQNKPRFITRVYKKIYGSTVIRCANGIISKNLNMRNKCFEKFKNERLILSERDYTNKGSHIVNDYDVIICGSDQVWNPEYTDDIFQLKNFNKKVKTIAYAASFGVARIEKDYDLSWLHGIDYISVREKTGVSIVKSVVRDKDITVVLDPTLLLPKEEWEKLSEYSQIEEKENYVFCYFLGDSVQSRRMAVKYAHENNLKIISIKHPNGFNIADCFLEGGRYNVSPVEFVYLVRNARKVFTDSFHCCVFSMIFHKDFYAFKRFKDNSLDSQNSRILDLLKRYGLSHRMVDSYSDIRKNDKHSIDYASIDEQIKKDRAESEKYLVNALERN